MHRIISCSTCILFILISTAIGYNSSDFNIQGVIYPGWEFVKDLFRENFIQDQDLGASVAAYYQGKLAFELWGGWFDESRTKLYDDTALQLVFSTSKGLVAAAVALAVQRGLLDYSALVTRYWSDYGQNGKENTTVADILSHRAGLSNVSLPSEQYLNWTAMIHTLEQAAPAWPPGSAQGYHALTYGWLAGELIRRVDPKKRSLGKFIQEEIANPVLLDFYIGLPSKLLGRVSPLALSGKSTEPVDESAMASLKFFNDPRVHQAEIPAVNAITNVWSVARFYSSLIGDLNDGKFKRVLTEDILKVAIKPSAVKDELDLVFQRSSPFGMGFALLDDVLPEFGSGVFGHKGAGGSIGFAAPTKNFSFAYVMNRLDTTATEMIDIRYKTILTKIAEVINK